MTIETQLLVHIDSKLKKEVQKIAFENDKTLKIVVHEALEDYINKIQKN